MPCLLARTLSLSLTHTNKHKIEAFHKSFQLFSTTSTRFPIHRQHNYVDILFSFIVPVGNHHQCSCASWRFAFLQKLNDSFSVAHIYCWLRIYFGFFDRKVLLIFIASSIWVMTPHIQHQHIQIVTLLCSLSYCAHFTQLYFIVASLGTTLLHGCYELFTRFAV